MVLTTGTFLNGLIHIGETKIPAGRMKIADGVEAPAIGLSKTLYGFGLKMGRLKTGTPPRLDGRPSIGPRWRCSRATIRPSPSLS